MTKAHYNDKVFYTAVHLTDEEAEVLRDFHLKRMEKLSPKIEKIIDKADGSTKYDVEIESLRNDLHYSRTSFDEACRIIRHFNDLKQIQKK